MQIEITQFKKWSLLDALHQDSDQGPSNPLADALPTELCVVIVHIPTWGT